MSSIIHRLLNRLFPGSSSSITILGLGSSGKTTLLYFLKLGEIVQTIPTIGFNVETVDIVTAKGNFFRMTGWDVGTGCGIRYLYGVLHHYINCGKALIWMVDASESECLPESVEALKQILLAASKARENIEGDKKELPILILVNKSDKPNAMSLDYVRIAFSKITSGKIAAVFKTSLTNNPEVKTGLAEAFDWLQLAIEIAESGKDTSPIKNLTETGPPNPRSPSTLANKLESWLTKIENDCSPDSFLDQFNSFSLPDWDHYTHIRIAYVILTKYGRKEGKDLIFKGLENYISVSPQTKGRSFHVTMTYFWIQIVHFGIRNMPLLTPEDSALSSSQPAPEDFSRFLLINPYVADGNLWSDYYAKDTIMSPKAKAEMILPDKKPLPNLVIRDAIKTFGASS